MSQGQNDPQVLYLHQEHSPSPADWSEGSKFITPDRPRPLLKIVSRFAAREHLLSESCLIK